MRKIEEYLVYSIPSFLALVTFGVCTYFVLVLKFDLPAFYEKNMRSSLFAGFLTLGSFLLTLKTGIVIKIKEGLYDNVKYQERIIERRKLNATLTVFGPLRRLAKLLSLSVISALVTAASQLTIGLIPNWIATATCLSMATLALSILLSAFCLIQSNLTDWFDLMEEHAVANKKEPERDTTSDL